MNFKMISTVSLTLLLLISCSEKSNTNEISKTQQIEMQKTAGDFMIQLKNVLLKVIESGGITNAVSVCSDTAQFLTNDFGLKRGVYVKRVSFKNRNKYNYPDKFESRILKEFERIKSKGNLSEQSEHIEITMENDHQYLRYMKPIFIDAVCLNCHGSSSEILPEVKDILSEKYPDDKAINYKSGDLRGAVSIKKVLK